LALKEVRPWLSRGDLNELLGADFLGSPTGKPEFVASLREGLLKRFQGRLEKSGATTDFSKIQQTLDRYLEKMPALLNLLKGYQTLEETLPPLKWEEVKARLHYWVRQGMVHPNAAHKILQWVEGDKDANLPPDPILSQYRSEFLAGILEFFFQESRTLKEQEEFSYLLMEICEREDLGMMRNLAIRFHNYQQGMDTRSRYFQKKGKAGSGELEIGLDRHENLKRALLETAKVYQKYPGFRGPYFEILEKAMDGDQPISARLNAPLHIGIQSLLFAGRSVELLAHPSLGVELVRVNGGSQDEQLKVISSIQNNLDKKIIFVHWMKKIIHEVEAAHQEPYEILLYIPRLRSEGIMREVPTWARDILEEHPNLKRVQLYLPDPSKGKAVGDPMDPSQYVPHYVDRASLTTEQRIKILKIELERGSQDVGHFLALYQLMRNSNSSVDLETEAFRNLLEARRIFSDNKTVAGEMWRVLDENFQGMHWLGHDKLSDFEPSDFAKNKENRASLELMAKDPLRFGVLQIEKSLDRLNARRSPPPASGPDPEMRQIRDLLFRLVDIATMPKAVGPRKGGIFKVLEEKDLSLGSLDHFHRVGLFMKAILGQPFPNLNLKEVFDLSPLGYETNSWRFGYDLKRPNRFTLRARIAAKQGSSSPYSRRNTSPTEMKEGVLTIGVEGISNRGETRLVVNIAMPEDQQGNGVGTLLVQKLISLGHGLGARYLVFRNVENSGKYALLKMGGKIRHKKVFDRAKFNFIQFVEQHIHNYNLWGFDLGAMILLRNGQEMANAYLDKAQEKLTVHPRWGTGEGVSDVFGKDPAKEELHQVGRLFFMQKNFLDWDIAFDLREESSSMKSFWEYYRHRFNLPQGKLLENPSDSNGDPEPSP
jgi:hypothetical protein